MNDLSTQPYFKGKTAFQLLEDLSMQMTGETGNPFEAFEQWQRERQALAELHDENQAYSIGNRKLWLALQLAEKAIAAAEKEAAMFITEKTRETIQKFREQYQKIESARAQDLELQERSRNHANSNT